MTFLRQTDRQADRQTDRPTDKWPGRQACTKSAYARERRNKIRTCWFFYGLISQGKQLTTPVHRSLFGFGRGVLMATGFVYGNH